MKLKAQYNKSVETLVKEGKYDWSNDNINDKNFPHKKSKAKTIELELLHFDKYISSEDAIKEMKKQGLRPTTMVELLSFGIQYPKEQLKYSIVALGSVWQRPFGSRGVGYLLGFGAERVLYLYWLESGWHGIYRFAATNSDLKPSDIKPSPLTFSALDLKKAEDKGFVKGWNACLDEMPDKMSEAGLKDLEYDE